MFKKRPAILFFLFTSVLLHLLILLLAKEFTVSVPPVENPVWVQLTEPELPIVDIPKPDEETIPANASAESLYNQAVPEETVAPSPLEPPSEGESQAPIAATKNEEQKKPAPPTKDLPSIYSKEEEKKERIPGLPDAVGQASPTMDFLPGFKVGNRTYINTDANPNIAYFIELKRKFRLTWNPAPSVRAHAAQISRGRIEVVLGVSVDRFGNLADLIVIRSSDLENYDQEGARTVKVSSPFSSPPENLLGNDGLLHMAWTFAVYL